MKINFRITIYSPTVMRSCMYLTVFEETTYILVSSNLPNKFSLVAIISFI